MNFPGLPWKAKWQAECQRGGDISKEGTNYIQAKDKQL